MKRSNAVLLVAGILFALSAANLLRSHGQKVAASEPNSRAVSTAVIAAPGRIEAVSEEIRVSSELSGRLKTVNVEEGDRVHADRYWQRLKTRTTAREWRGRRGSWRSGKRNCGGR